MGAATATQQDLWAWFSGVPAGTEKSAAQSLMQTQFAALGGDGGIQSDFNNKVTVALHGAADVDVAYKTIYKLITDVAKPTTAAPIPALHKQSHSFSAEQQKSALSAMQTGLGERWDHTWKAGNTPDTEPANFNNAGYKPKTTVVWAIMNVHANPAAAPANAHAGKKFYDVYLAATQNKDTAVLNLFDRKLVAKLATGVE